MIQPKKSLGQHFLKDKNIITKIVNHFQPENCKTCIEIGPGTGALTEFLLKTNFDFRFVEIDSNAFEFLCDQFPENTSQFIHQSFLEMDIKPFPAPLALIGNLPYNISSQIIFKILENKELVQYGVFMVQREVAERLASGSGSKTYGILSVLLQTFYDVELLFNVCKNVFVPPPKVESTVFKITRRSDTPEIASNEHFFALVKKAFNQRRKMLRKSLSGFIDFNNSPENIHVFSDKRPEQLTKEDFLTLSNYFFQK